MSKGVPGRGRGAAGADGACVRVFGWALERMARRQLGRPANDGVRFPASHHIFCDRQRRQSGCELANPCHERGNPGPGTWKLEQRPHFTTVLCMYICLRGSQCALARLLRRASSAATAMHMFPFLLLFLRRVPGTAPHTYNTCPTSCVLRRASGPPELSCAARFSVSAGSRGRKATWRQALVCVLEGGGTGACATCDVCSCIITGLGSPRRELGGLRNLPAPHVAPGAPSPLLERVRVASRWPSRQRPRSSTPWWPPRARAPMAAARRPRRRASNRRWPCDPDRDDCCEAPRRPVRGAAAVAAVLYPGARLSHVKPPAAGRRPARRPPLPAIVRCVARRRHTDRPPEGGTRPFNASEGSVKGRRAGRGMQRKGVQGWEGGGAFWRR